MSDSKNCPKNKDPGGGKKKLKLKSIKKKIVKPNQLKSTITSDMFLKFNGQNKSKIYSNKKEGIKDNIDALMETHVELKAMMNDGMKKNDIKKLNALAKELLSKEDTQFIDENYEALKEEPDFKGCKKADLTLSLVYQRTAELIESFNDAKEVKELEDEYPIFLKEVEEMKKKLKKQEEENIKDEELNEDEINTASKIFDIVKPKESGEAMEMEDEGELTNEEMKKALDVLLEGKKELNIYDKNNFLRELSQHKKGIDSLLQSTANTLKNDPNLIIISKGDIKRENIIKLLSNNEKGVDPISLINLYSEYMTTNESQFSDGDLFTALIIKGIVYELNKLKNSIQNVVKSLTDKIQIDDKVQSKVMKGKNNTEMKKVFTSSYVPQDEWDKMSSVQKALKNVKDFDQFPKFPIWKSYKDEEKIAFLQERLKWNIARQKFLINLLQGKDISSNPYGFRSDINAAVALNNNLYYTDKYSRGGWCPEFIKLSKKIDKKVMEEHNVTRNIAKAAIKRLCELKRFKGFVYRKGVSITLDNETFWNKNDLDEIADKLIQEDRVKRPFIYAKGNFARTATNPPRNKAVLGKKRKPEAPLKGEDLYALGVNPKNFIH